MILRMPSALFLYYCHQIQSTPNDIKITRLLLLYYLSAPLYMFLPYAETLWGEHFRHRLSTELLILDIEILRLYHS